MTYTQIAELRANGAAAAAPRQAACPGRPAPWLGDAIPTSQHRIVRNLRTHTQSQQLIKTRIASESWRHWLSTAVRRPMASADDGLEAWHTPTRGTSICVHSIAHVPLLVPMPGHIYADADDFYGPCHARAYSDKADKDGETTLIRAQ
jgi:hypothetical protein